MSIQDIVDKVAADHKLTKTEARSVVDTVLASIASGAKKGEVSLPGFGKFKVTSRPARTGRNPRTGETIKIAASKKLGFTAAKALRDSL